MIQRDMACEKAIQQVEAKLETIDNKITEKEQEIENLKSIGAEWPRIDREYSRTFEYLEGIQDNMELQRMEEKRQSDLVTYGQIG